MAASWADRNQRTGGGFEEQPFLEPSGPPERGGRDLSWLPERVGEVFRTLLEAQRYASDLQQDIWEFAIELKSLRKQAITETDLRWIVRAGFVDFAFEITLPNEPDRQFRRSPNLVFIDSVCFVLTSSGIEAAEEAAGVFSANRSPKESNAGPASGSANESTAGSRPGDDWIGTDGDGPGLLSISHQQPRQVTSRRVPRWDRDRQELRVGEVVVKRFKAPAANQEAILAAFEEEDWPHRIDDPLSPQPELEPKRRLHDTINSLNRKQKTQLIRFFGDGRGEGIRWEYVEPGSSNGV